MKIFKGKFTRFITFATIGLLYDIVGTINISLVYKPYFKSNSYQTTNFGRLSFLIESPAKLKQFFYLGMILIFFGFVLLLINEIINMAKPKNVVILETILLFFSIIIFITIIIFAYILYCVYLY